MDGLLSVKAIFDVASPFLERLSIIRVILGFILVFFLPGFAWTFVFLRQINIIERIVFSFALSLVIVTLSLLFVNILIGIKITGINSALVIIVVIILPVGVYYLNRLIRRSRGRAT